MKPFKGDKKLRWFEEILRRDVDDSVLDLSSVEFGLINRIDLVEQMGELGLLKLDEIPSEELMDRVQAELFAQIRQFREYDEPVDECIRQDEKLPQSRWNLLEQHLEEKISEAEQKEKWEQCLMVDMEMPHKKWESHEKTLFDKISGYEQDELWEKAARTDEVNQPASAEKQEMVFEEMLARTDQLPDWEKYVRSELIRPCSFWEKVERKLFDRIERQGDRMDLAHQPFWFFLEYYFGRLKAASVGVVTVLVLLVSLWGGSHFLREELQLPTLVYQVQGAAAENFDFASRDRTHFSSKSGGAVTLVNNHGFMQLKNGSSVRVERLSRGRALYRVEGNDENDVSEPEREVAFYAKKQQSRKRFSVATPDYSVEVTGTYFSIEPGSENRYSTRVFEGAVQIRQGDKEVQLKAGQSYVYDPQLGEYVVRDSGKVIPRSEIEKIPDVEQISGYRVLKIRSAVPGSEVTIDGKHLGIAPLALYHSPGNHRIQISKNGYNSVDTVISLGSDSVYSLDVELAKIKEEKKRYNPLFVRNAPRVRSEPEPEKSLRGVDSAAERKSGENASGFNYKKAREEELSGNYRAAIRLYESVFKNRDAKKAHREDALFSMGKLKAEHVSAREAKEVFLTYLAFFPEGFFAGESWLRLAELEFGGNQRKSLEYYNKYLERFPRNHRTCELQNRVGLIYLQIGRSEKAAEMFRAALSNMTPGQKKERKNILLNLHNALKTSGDEQGSERVWLQYRAEVNMQRGR
ncbi:MAG: PEGA domain-containing protein [Chitinispirillaceae bacterium]